MPARASGFKSPFGHAVTGLIQFSKTGEAGFILEQSDIDKRLASAEIKLKHLVGEEIPAISLNSLNAEEAPFLGKIVSKLSPLIGNILENRIVTFLNETKNQDFYWVRQDPDFPDALLKTKAGEATNAGFEIKAWYALSTEITGRFRESQNLLANKNIKVVLVSWMLSHIVYGTPKILDVMIVDASKVAESRDSHYHNPPDYLISEPNDTTLRTPNLRQTNVLGYKWQETDTERFKQAHELVAGHKGSKAHPHEAAGKSLVEELMNTYVYRLDTNFAKIDRIDNKEIESFKSVVLARDFRGKKVSEWIRLISNLNSEDAETSTAAAETIQKIYSDL